jgi:hypothetical protein
VGVALLSLVEGLQGALSAETALGLLPAALVLHAHMSPPDDRTAAPLVSQ